MKTMKLAAIASMLILNACDTSTSPTDPQTNQTSSRKMTVSGKVDMTQANGASVKIVVHGISATPDANGNYSMSFDVVQKFGARTLATDTLDTTKVILDTAKLVVGTDTLREIPLTSWSNILPTNYIVQRNVSVTVPTKFASNNVEAVFWTNDSIANVVTLGSGTTPQAYSGFIYTVYDDSMYAANSHLYYLFARVKNDKDSVLAYTNPTDIHAKVGNLDYVSTQFVSDLKFDVKGFTLTPNDSSVSKFNISKSFSPDTAVWDSTFAKGNWAPSGYYYDILTDYQVFDTTSSWLIIDSSTILWTHFNKMIINFTVLSSDSTLPIYVGSTANIGGSNLDVGQNFDTLIPISNGTTYTVSLNLDKSRTTLNKTVSYTTIQWSQPDRIDTIDTIRMLHSERVAYVHLNKVTLVR